MEELTLLAESLYSLERPSWGIGGLAVPDIRAEVRRISESLDRLKGPDRFIALPFAEGQDKSPAIVLFGLLALARNEGIDATILDPFHHPALDPSTIPKGWILIHQAPRIAGLELAFQRSPSWWRGRAVVATGLETEWDAVARSLPVRFHDLGQKPMNEAYLGRVVAGELAILRAGGRIRNAWLLAAAFETFGAPIPFRLLARALRTSEDATGLAVADSDELLFMIDREDPPGLLVCTRGETVARATVNALLGARAPARIEALQRRALQFIDPGEAEERQAALGLCVGLHRRGHRERLSRLLSARWLERCLRSASAPEMIGWGSLLEDLARPDLAVPFYGAALRLRTGDAGILHAHGRAVGAAFPRDPRRRRLALSALRRAGTAEPGNPYIPLSLDRLKARVGAAFRIREITGLAGLHRTLSGAALRAAGAGVTRSWELLRERDLRVTLSLGPDGELVAAVRRNRRPVAGATVTLQRLSPPAKVAEAARARTDRHGSASLGRVRKLKPLRPGEHYDLCVSFPEPSPPRATRTRK